MNYASGRVCVYVCRAGKSDFPTFPGFHTKARTITHRLALPVKYVARDVLSDHGGGLVFGLVFGRRRRKKNHYSCIHVRQSAEEERRRDFAR